MPLPHLGGVQRQNNQVIPCAFALSPSSVTHEVTPSLSLPLSLHPSLISLCLSLSFPPTLPHLSLSFPPSLPHLSLSLPPSLPHLSLSLSSSLISLDT